MTAPDVDPIGRQQPSEGSLRWQRCRVTVYGLLLPVHLLMLGWLACRYSPTADEPAHLAAGIRVLSEGAFDLYPVNPPLVKSVAAMAVMLDGVHVSWEGLDLRPGVRSEWTVGRDLMQSNGADSRWHFVLARWACLPFAALGLIYCWRWGAEVFGPVAGLAAATFWAFSPNILGNGCLITPDVAATSLGLASLFSVRHWLLHWRWSSVFFASVFLGLSQLAKMTSLLWYPVIGLLFALAIWTSGKNARDGATAHHNVESPTPPWRTQFAQLAVLVVLSLYLLNVGYGFSGSLEPLGEREFLSKSLMGSSSDEENSTVTGNRFRGTWLGRLPMPFPSDYLAGIDLQRRDFEGGWRPLWSYRAGEHRLGGWWDFYLYCVLVKTPCGLWLVALACIATLYRGGLRIPRDPILEWALLLLPAVVVFVVASLETGFSRSFRYVLPCFPFVFIMLGSVWGTAARESGRWPRRIAGIGLGSFLAASLWTYPHSLAFFNMASGGITRGHWHLLDSNLDWGQDLYFLRDWIRRNPDKQLAGLSYPGAADPQLFGINVPPLSRPAEGMVPARQPGWYAVSANSLHGFDTSNGPWQEFLDRLPADRAGASILIYNGEREPQ